MDLTRFFFFSGRCVSSEMGGCVDASSNLETVGDGSLIHLISFLGRLRYCNLLLILDLDGSKLEKQYINIGVLGNWLNKSC